MLPASTHREILDMLAVEGQVTARLLQKIRDKVQRWYHDNGYVCAQVVNFGNLNTREVVCEVVEGDITQVVVQFQDKLGNVCEGNTQFGVVRRELPKYVSNNAIVVLHPHWINLFFVLFYFLIHDYVKVSVFYFFGNSIGCIHLFLHLVD